MYRLFTLLGEISANSVHPTWTTVILTKTWARTRKTLSWAAHFCTEDSNTTVVAEQRYTVVSVWI